VIDRARVLHMAKLSSLSLSDPEVDAMARELSRIAEYVAKLDELDTREVPPTTHLSGGSALRADEPHPGLSHEDALAGAPRTARGGFAVPLFLDAPMRARARAPK
jgi:aspartyl-tRNA(Asn)/glutamyl-tRNA(Gln) amidotransferase subunit C